jgi:hypothetical protein
MDAALVNTFLEVAYPVISSAALSASRAMGLVVITPAFNRLGLTGMIRGCVAVAISVPMFLPTFTAFTSMPEHGSFWLAGLLIKEFLIGLLVGLLFGIPFWAAEVAGELIDLQRGSTMAQLVDPLSSGESSVMATLLTVMLITLFFMAGHGLYPPVCLVGVAGGVVDSRSGDAHRRADGFALDHLPAGHRPDAGLPVAHGAEPAYLRLVAAGEEPVFHHSDGDLYRLLDPLDA